MISLFLEQWIESSQKIFLFLPRLIGPSWCCAFSFFCWGPQPQTERGSITASCQLDAVLLWTEATMASIHPLLFPFFFSPPSSLILFRAPRFLFVLLGFGLPLSVCLCPFTFCLSSSSLSFSFSLLFLVPRLPSVPFQHTLSLSVSRLSRTSVFLSTLQSLCSR